VSGLPRSIAAAGLAALFVILAAVGGLVYRRPQTTYAVSASFPRAIGLFPGSTVRVLGVPVGRIGSVTPNGDRVDVVLNVEEGVRVPPDASAIIVPISLISDRYVQLEPVWRSGPYLRDGDRIPLERGIAPAELDDLLASLKDLLEAIEPGEPGQPGALGALVENANRALDGQGEALGSTIDGLATVLDVVGRNADDLDSLIVSFDQVVGSLARRDAAVAATNRGLASVFGALAEERDALASGLGNLATAVEEVGGLVASHRSDLEADLTTLERVADLLVRRESFFVRNLRWLPVLEQGVINAFEETDSFGMPSRRFMTRDCSAWRDPSCQLAGSNR
jgi:phospholipid/cholesterol/gamma-HCH transport system substrate-binding protein